MIKIILEHHFTKMDVDGNVYRSVRVTSTRTGKSFATETPSKSNAIYDILYAFGPEVPSVYVVDVPTGSARISSLPYAGDACVSGDDGWEGALRGIGFKFKRN